MRDPLATAGKTNVGTRFVMLNGDLKTKMHPPTWILRSLRDGQGSVVAVTF